MDKSNNSNNGSSWSLTSVSPLLQRQKQLSGSTSSLPPESKVDINTRDKKGRNTLFYAARNGDVEVAKKYLESGGDINRADNFGVSPLHEATERSKIDIIELLVQFGCNLNIKNILGQTPLMRAVLYDDLEVVKILHKAGADLDERDCTGKTALMIGLQESREDGITYLLHAGSNVHLQDRLGQSALYITMKEAKRTSNEIIRKLLKAGYDYNRDSHWLKTSEMEDLQKLEQDSHHHSGILHKIASKVKGKHHHHPQKNGSSEQD
ncbi:ankycorbin-like [Mizuhopecten yessoensis]|uniref:Ankyrin repeat protein n=1 Tax=Mizuhopecten yessoensis TaxID=6573 RepID=A0A210QXD2_MIZYE|nr:ankycorbin-like [Mizuhopecten yessoensis]XP_021347225.1 ankycorbin-like [Mizuhopecten yessoensis]XP_021347226.1 ankycorbin-like [Mizuhopecten yessoensis]XP_021347227.1 ankycorbin-like [Mizuhopecten yessoensis]XP_021347228.1 ankycorbin-like [Mizuhopecten yessoensis]OWF53419.1 Ankyrin repeat protein [Mizuhopecten yessoensis]